MYLCYFHLHLHLHLNLSFQHLVVHLKLISGFEIRSAKRLVNYKYELKIWGLKNLKFLYQIDTNLQPPSSDFAVINTSFNGLAGIS